MVTRRRGPFARFWDADRGPYALLAMTVISSFVITPLVVTGMLHPLIVDIFFILFMFAGALTVHPHRVVRYVVLAIAVLPVMTRVASQAIPGPGIVIADAVAEVIAVGMFALLVMKQFLVPGRPASHRIGAAIVVYLLVGILWSRLYQIAGIMIPGAFHTPEGSSGVSSYVYFSFVTLATVGYGDMTPVHPFVRNLAVLEAVTGQMYIAVLIARLVSTSDQSH